jgi:plasmid stabilization system protein ParE
LRGALSGALSGASNEGCGRPEEGQPTSYELVYLAPAQRDLARLRDFLIDRGLSQKRAHEIVGDIVVKLRILKDNPRTGFSFGGKYGFETPYRGLVCSKYIAVYEAIEIKPGTGRVEIRRIYHVHEDYLNQLMQES